MKPKKIHIIPAIFCGLLSLPLILIVVLQLWQFYLINTAYERMEEEHIQTLVVKSEQVVWKEEGREVTIDGAYFDLVSWSLKDGNYTFTGAYDREETAVANMLEKQTGMGNFISRLMLFSQCLAAIVIYVFSFLNLPYLLKQFAFFSTRYKFLFRKIISPPPRLFHSFSE